MLRKVYLIPFSHLTTFSSSYLSISINLIVPLLTSIEAMVLCSHEPGFDNGVSNLTNTPPEPANSFLSASSTLNTTCHLFFAPFCSITAIPSLSNLPKAISCFDDD